MNRFPHCRNCQVVLRRGILCEECGRMILATVAGELVVAVTLFLVRAAWR